MWPINTLQYVTHIQCKMPIRFQELINISNKNKTPTATKACKFIVNKKRKVCCNHKHCRRCRRVTVHTARQLRTSLKEKKDTLSVIVRLHCNVSVNVRLQCNVSVTVPLRCNVSVTVRLQYNVSVTVRLHAMCPLLQSESNQN